MKTVDVETTTETETTSGERSTKVETETREETEVDESSLLTMPGRTTTSVSGSQVIRLTVEAGAAPGESVQTEVFQSQEAYGSIVTRTVKTVTRILTSVSGEFMKTVDVETTTETETTSGERITQVEMEKCKETEVDESSLLTMPGSTTTSVSGAQTIRSTVEDGAAPGESVQTEVL